MTCYLTIDHFNRQSFTDIALQSPKLCAKGMGPVHTADNTRSYAIYQSLLRPISEKQAADTAGRSVG
ncbi:hypothetical protein [Paenibacillus sp. S150]|uniref:hypothetical protein n=1 Tax=Paenibacillus sp. S150 TaxID=2749826 RepID=UPI001C59C1DF|nr:hypothetical protein [Paenibacillus sp. S150]MBW4082366.1 hypothetical protein [Paenibacillus sp. S150]